MRSAIVLVAVLTVCLGSPRRPVPRHPNADLIDGAIPRIGDSRIINGDSVDIEEYPWQASLKYASGGSHTCGASIISPTWLVSAAHCTQNPASTYLVGVGNSYLSEQVGELKNIKRIINHGSYNQGPGGYPNDISLIELEEPLDLTGESIQAIDLPSTNSDFAGELCYISGWGRTSGGGALPNKLRAVGTEVLSRWQCMARWGWNNINDGHVCIGGVDDEGSCNGDSGGPLMCKVNGKEQLVGATSWGAVGCDASLPSVYSRITYFREWIYSVTGI